jgi:predicted anti-sigma-YlaC factor YlaD
MHLKTFSKWIRRIYTTRDEELDCDGVARLIPQYVDLEVAGKGADVRFPEVKHHLSQCPECYDVYLTLHDIALMESREASSEPMALERS